MCASNYSPPSCLSPAPSSNTQNNTRTHSNRWLILTEIIRQQSHQHGSVVIRVWTQCLFCGRNGRSARPRSVEMHYSLRCPDPIQRHKVARSPTPFFPLSVPASVIFSACLSLWAATVSNTDLALAQSYSEELTRGMSTSQVCHVECCW